MTYLYKNKLETKLNVLRSDNGLEFVLGQFKEFLETIYKET